MNSSQDPKSAADEAESTMNIVMFVIQMHCTAVEVLLHRWMGERYLGLQAVGVLLLVPCHAYFHQGANVSLLIDYLPLYLAACFAQRVGTYGRKRKGLLPHSYDSGFPIFLSQNTRFDEVFFKTWIEPFLVILIGLAITTFNRPLGAFFLTCGVSLFLKMAMMNRVNHSRALDMRDGMIAQQNRADRFRQVNGPASVARGRWDGNR